MEEEGEALHEAHAPRRHRVQVLQHEEPDLAGSLHQQELEAGPSDDGGPALGLVRTHEAGLQQRPHRVSRDPALLAGGHHVVEDGLPPLRGVLVEEGDVPGAGVRVQVGGHGPWLAAPAQRHPQVGAERPVEEPGLEAEIVLSV